MFDSDIIDLFFSEKYLRKKRRAGSWKDPAEYEKKK